MKNKKRKQSELFIGLISYEIIYHYRCINKSLISLLLLLDVESLHLLELGHLLHLLHLLHL